MSATEEQMLALLASPAHVTDLACELRRLVAVRDRDVADYRTGEEPWRHPVGYASTTQQPPD